MLYKGEMRIPVSSASRWLLGRLGPALAIALLFQALTPGLGLAYRTFEHDPEVAFPARVAGREVRWSVAGT